MVVVGQVIFDQMVQRQEELAWDALDSLYEQGQTSYEKRADVKALLLLEHSVKGCFVGTPEYLTRAKEDIKRALTMSKSPRILIRGRWMEATIVKREAENLMADPSTNVDGLMLQGEAEMMLELAEQDALKQKLNDELAEIYFNQAALWQRMRQMNPASRPQLEVEERYLKAIELYKSRSDQRGHFGVMRSYLNYAFALVDTRAKEEVTLNDIMKAHSIYQYLGSSQLPARFQVISILIP